MIKINGKEFPLNKFPDGTFNLKDTYNDVSKFNIEWYFENNEEMVALMFIANHLKNKNKEIHLFMPYVPNARQDRVKKQEDVFTLKYFAQFINNLKFDSVKVLDPHSDISGALFDKLIIENPKIYINRVLNILFANQSMSFYPEYPIIFYPDEGAMKRYSEMFNLPYTFGFKNRDWETGKIINLDIVDKKLVKNKNILIVDDICCKGGTFYHSAQKLKTCGAKHICLYVTHCEKTIRQGKLFEEGLIEKIFTTNSLPWDNSDLKLIQRMDIINEN